MHRNADWLREATDHSVPPNRRHTHVHYDLTRPNPVAGVVVREPWRLKHLFVARGLHAFGSDRETAELIYLGGSDTMAGVCSLIAQYEEVTRRA